MDSLESPKTKLGTYFRAFNEIIRPPTTASASTHTCFFVSFIILDSTYPKKAQKKRLVFWSGTYYTKVRMLMNQW